MPKTFPPSSARYGRPPLNTRITSAFDNGSSTVSQRPAWRNPARVTISMKTMNRPNRLSFAVFAEIMLLRFYAYPRLKSTIPPRLLKRTEVQPPDPDLLVRPDAGEGAHATRPVCEICPSPVICPFALVRRHARHRQR